MRGDNSDLGRGFEKRWPRTPWVVGAGVIAVVVASSISLGGLHFPPTTEDNTAFWVDFWPQFAATGFAVIAGIPAGLYIQSQVERASQRKEAVDRAMASRELLGVIGISVENNRKALVRLIDTLTSGVIPVGSGLDRGAFTLMRDDIRQLIDDRWLKADLASWYNSIEDIHRLTELYWGLETQVPTRVDDLQGARAALRAELLDYSTAMLEGPRFTNLHDRVYERYVALSQTLGVAPNIRPPDISSGG